MKNPSIAKLAKSAGDNRQSPMQLGILGTGLKTLYNKVTGNENKKTTPKKSDPYADAKKKDPKLDSYIKERNKHKKGTPEYNAQQNKINKAYGKGPTNRSTTPKKEDKGNFVDAPKTEPKKTEPKKAEPKTTETKSKKRSLRPKLGKGVETLKEKNKRKYGGKRGVYNPRLNRFE